MRKRVCVVVTARPSYSRVKTVLAAIKRRPDLDLSIIAAASAMVTRYGRVVDQMRVDGFEPDAEIPSVVDGDRTIEAVLSTGLLLTQIGGALARLEPDVVVTIADRHETIATAVAASYQHIPLCHIQGGEVSGSIDDKVRNAVTQLADVHCVATAQAGLRVGQIRPGAEVYVSGCPSVDVASDALRAGPLPASEIIVLQHAVTSEAHEAAEQMRATIKALHGMDVTWFWPGEDAGNQAMAKELRLAGIKAIRNKPPVEFLRMLLGCKVLVGNSSVGIRECSYLGVPVVNVGTRQAGRERGPNVLQADYHPTSIGVAVDAWRWGRKPDRTMIYGDGRAGERIASILAGQPAEAVA